MNSDPTSCGHPRVVSGTWAENGGTFNSTAATTAIATIDSYIPEYRRRAAAPGDRGAEVLVSRPNAQPAQRQQHSRRHRLPVSGSGQFLRGVVLADRLGLRPRSKEWRWARQSLPEPTAAAGRTSGSTPKSSGPQPKLSSWSTVFQSFGVSSRTGSRTVASD